VALRKATCGLSVDDAFRRAGGRPARYSELVGQSHWRSVPPSGRKLGPPAAHLIVEFAMFSFGIHRFDPVPTMVVVTGLLLSMAMIWAY